MSVAANRGPLERAVTGELSEIVGMILDKGLVIDAFVRVSLVGIEVLTVDAKVVVASIDTYLRYAETMARLDATKPAPQTLPDILEGVAEGVTKGALGAVRQTITPTAAAADAASSVASPATARPAPPPTLGVTMKEAQR